MHGRSAGRTSLQVNGALFLRYGAKFNNVRLSGANIRGQIALVGASFDGDFVADGVQARDLLMHSQLGTRT